MTADAGPGSRVARLKATVHCRLRGLLLAGVGLVAIAGGTEGVFAQSLPWPDANPVARLDRPATRSHRSHSHRAAGRRAVVHKRAPNAVETAKALKRVAGDSVPAAAAPSAVPLPTARIDRASVGEDADGDDAVPKPRKPPAEQGKTGEPGGSAAADADPGPPPKSAEGANAAIARSGLDVVAPRDREDDGTGATPTSTGSAPDVDASADRTGKAGIFEAGSDGSGPEDSGPVSAESLPITAIPLPETRPDASIAPGKSSAAPDPAPDAAGEQSPTAAPNSTEKLKSRVPEMTPAAMVQAAAAVEDAKDCEAELTKRGAVFSVGASIAEGECGVLRPVELKTLSSGVTITPPTVLLCRAALALDVWMSDSVVPAARLAFPDDDLKTFRHASTYVCRPRASEAGISEHARGSAIDIGGFGFASGRDLGIEAQKDGTSEARFQHLIRAAACGPFKTVLGPGTNADHATHFHLDIAARRNGATYCK